MELQDHELRVKHKATGVVQVVSKSYFHSLAGAYEVLDGAPGEPVGMVQFIPTKKPLPKVKVEKEVLNNKMDTGETEDKTSKSKNKLLPPPAL